MRALWRLARAFTVTFAYTIFATVVVRFVPMARRARFRARLLQHGCIRLCGIFGIRLTPRGEAVDEHTALAVCNHFGVLDPFVLASVLPVSFAGKAEIAAWPFAGWVAREFGVIFVERERQRTVSAFMEAVGSRMQAHVPVLVFPEGTTSPDASVKPFKTGAFAAVSDLPGARVLPLYLKPVRVDGVPIADANRREVTWADGTETFGQNLLRMLAHRSIEMEIWIGKPLRATGVDRKALAGLAHESVVALRNQSAGATS